MTQPQPQPKGLDDPTMIDMVRLTPNEDAIELIIVHDKAWEGSTRQILALQEKWQTYVGFAIYGTLARNYPDYAHLPWRIVVETTGEPDPKTKQFLGRANEESKKQGGEVVVAVKRPAPKR